VISLKTALDHGWTRMVAAQFGQLLSVAHLARFWLVQENQLLVPGFANKSHWAIGEQGKEFFITDDFHRVIRVGGQDNPLVLRRRDRTASLGRDKADKKCNQACQQGQSGQGTSHGDSMVAALVPEGGQA